MIANCRRFLLIIQFLSLTLFVVAVDVSVIVVVNVEAFTVLAFNESAWST